MHNETGFNTALDAALLVRAQRQDRAAFEAIYRCYERAALALALRILGRHAAAEDAVHDCFVRAFEKIRHYRGEAPFGSWLKRMLVNLAIDRLRAETRWSVDADAIDALAAPAGQHDDQIEALGLLARLAPRARSVVWLHEMEGYAHGEIARLFGQTESWSKSILARSLDRLRREIQQEND